MGMPHRPELPSLRAWTTALAMALACSAGVDERQTMLLLRDTLTDALIRRQMGEESSALLDSSWSSEAAPWIKLAKGAGCCCWEFWIASTMLRSSLGSKAPDVMLLLDMVETRRGVYSGGGEEMELLDVSFGALVCDC